MEIETDFKLPTKNHLIPNNFVIYATEKLPKNEKPVKLSEEGDLIELWFMQDKVY